MNKEVREFAGLLALVASLIFVGLEMRQNTNMMRAQIRNSMSENTMTYLGWQATSPALADVMVKARLEGEIALTSGEERQMRPFVSAQIREWENSFYQNKMGLFTDMEFQARVATWRYRLKTSPDSALFLGTWTRTKQLYAEDFQDEVDRVIREASGP
ncbi:MAG: hypothetical protein ACPHO4_15465 [Longimicrobiales bacterium]